MMPHDSAEITYVEMIKTVQAETRLSATQRRTTISAIKCFVRCFEPRGLTCAVRSIEVSQILKRATAMKAGRGERSFRNMISLVRRAMLLCSIIQEPGRHTEALSPCWKALLPPANTWARWRLSRFFIVASERGWDPTAITPEHFRIFHSLVETSAVGKNLRNIVKNAVWQWNRLAQTVDGITPVEYRMPHPHPRFSLRWEQYPASLQKELKSFLEQLTKPNFLSEEDERPLRPASVNTLSWRLRLFAGALVGCGQAPGSITSLSQLCTLDAFKAGLSFLRDRAQGTTLQVLGIAEGVYSLAKRRSDTDPAELARMKKIIVKLRYELRRPGLSERNIRKLAQFDTPRNRDAILLLPQRLYTIAKRERDSGHFSRARAASMVLTAAVIELLLMCPLRISNVASMDLQKHVRRSATAKSLSTHIYIPGNETKNGVEIHFELPEQSARLLEEYITDFRPDVPHQPSTLLFPARNGGRRGDPVFWLSITKAARRYAGVETNPHLFRHLAAKFYLDENPGGYEVVRRTLGHRSMNTTVQFYAGQETEKTFRHFDETILRKRQQAAARSRMTTRRGR